MSVSVIIPSYNRFKYLLNAIESVRNQTYKASQIIVVNDGSSQPEYYTHKFGDDVTLVHLSKNSRSIFGKIAASLSRNLGIQVSNGDYIAFLDDDDLWLPNKLELQIRAMRETGCKMSCTEGLWGEGEYGSENKYLKYNSEKHFEILNQIFLSKGSELLKKGFPRIWNLQFLMIHNCAITSSVVISRDLVLRIGGFDHLPSAEDYLFWLKTLQQTNCVYVDEPCVYYDGKHGDGQLYK